MRIALLGAVTLLVALAGCSGVRTVTTNSPDGESRVYAMSQEQADAVLLRTMLATFPDSHFERADIPAPAVRYQARMSFGLDRHRIVATAVPATGHGPDGRPIQGYTFQIGDAGTMILQGVNRAAKAFENLRDELAAFEPLPARR